jgi:AraC-like DNA-binding protein
MLPHYWRNYNEPQPEQPDTASSYYVLQFSHSFLFDALTTYPELIHVKEMLTNAARGIQFLHPYNNIFGKAIADIYLLSGFSRFIGFLNLLDQMARCPKIKLLAPHDAPHDLSPDMGERLNKLLSHINRHYQHRLTLDDTALWFGMNTTAFARYFKRKTGKTFINYVNDLRIAFSCKLLQKGNLNVSQACFESGFNNISNFNRHFKKLMKQTPSDYAANYLNKIRT